ncbi:MFS transporter [Pseudobacteriovorax antillogorgiicola]|uniref:Fucose permease n=1 Tax=Pseudobacteriovorax antillogorgiicola TaxID=1513793 RepID=A0A1Y6CMK6_9BACT|nr:MFS transporter [Pseudobacteriovorax antillogorgiicola]TCS44576.1 fucose permease [Pseudobacteriovorax antillogorgiicola]SMF77986.1 Fucose permease [Pseudobacteriovorax antillogorgiicola]
MSRTTIHPGYVFAGIATLVSVSFLDNIRGPLLPILCERLNLSYSYGGLFLTIGNFAAVVSTLMMGRALKRHSEKKVTLFICGFCALPGFIAPWVHDLVRLLALGLVMGAGVALMGSICNILTIKGSPSHLRGRLLSIQQVMYGVGSFLGPMTFAWFYEAQYPWWTAISIMSLANLILAGIITRVVPDEPAEDHDLNQPKEPFQWYSLVPVTLFAIYVGGEVLTSMWMSTYFIQVQNYSTVDASQLTSYFFLAISSSRFLSFLLVRPQWERMAMIGSLVLGITFILLAINGYPKLMPLAGLLGPFFPLFMAQVSHIYPKLWKSMTIWIFTAIQTSLALIHLSVGQLTDWVGIERAFYLAPLMITIALFMSLSFFRNNPIKFQST